MDVKTEFIDLNIDNTITPAKEEHLKLKTVNFPKSYHQKFTHNNTVEFKETYSNGLLNTIINAYNYHLGLVLSPDDILICINNIISCCINNDKSGFYRGLLVNHDGQKKLEVDMDKLRAQNSDSDIWDLTMEKWISLIKEDIKKPDVVQNMICDFSTSSDLETVVSYGFIMDSLKKFYGFYCSTMCGIPKVKLMGTLEDWQKLKGKVESLSSVLKLDFAPYAEQLLPILDQFIATKRGNPDKDWWSKMVSHTVRHGSGGGTFWSGWILTLFPNMNLKTSSILFNVMPGLTNTPVKFNNNGEKIDLTLEAGFHGTYQHDDGSLEVIRGYKLKKTELEPDNPWF